MIEQRLRLTTKKSENHMGSDSKDIIWEKPKRNMIFFWVSVGNVELFDHINYLQDYTIQHWSLLDEWETKMEQFILYTLQIPPLSSVFF